MSATWRYDRPEALAINLRPSLSVAVVIACRGGQDKLDLVLASLKAQSYPSRLINVYIVDDGSTPALKLPAIRPTKSKILKFKNAQDLWGKTDATNHVISKLKEDVVWCMDADMVMHPDHLAHMMKWHHESDDYLVLGWKRFVPDWNYNPKELSQALSDGKFHELHQESEGKEGWETLITGTKDLRNPGLESFRAVVGATFSISRKNWLALGGYNPLFKTGEDTELGWRVLMSGIRMVPERDAHSWHLGISTVEQHMETVIQHNRPLFANYIPGLAYLRGHAPLTWAVAENQVIVDCRNMSFEAFKSMVNEFLSDRKGQAKFLLLGPWSELPARYRVIEDPLKDVRAIYRYCMADARFAFEILHGDEVLMIDDILEKMKVASSPYIYFTEGSLDERIRFGALRHKITKSKNGLEGFVDTKDQRTFLVFAPALGRARRMPGKIYSNIEQQWGLEWVEISQFDFSKNLSLRTLFPLIFIALRSFAKVRRPKDLKNLIKRIIKVTRNSLSK